MKPTSPATPAAPHPPAASPAPAPPESPKPGAAQTTAPPPDAPLDQDGSYTFVYTIDAQITRRLMTRTGRGTKEAMLVELPRYVERIVKRAMDNEVY